MEFRGRIRRRTPMKPHQFISITEEQWKSGKSRHSCAECSRDYGDPVHCSTSLASSSSPMSSWPVVVVIEDCHIPQWAGKIVELAQSAAQDTIDLVIHWLVINAEAQIYRERMN